MKTSRRIFLASPWILAAGFALFSALFFAWVGEAQSTPASLYLTPSSGTFTVGSTFTVSIFVNTGGQVVNAVQADLKFPADRLQVVSPSAGKSFVGIWVVQPTYDNRVGAIKFQGAIPTPGVNTSSGLISEVTFRVVSVGTAIVKFEDSSRVLLNDGKGTDVLGQTTGGVYNLVLPPPAGPTVVSPTHQDQEQWHSNSSVTLEWGASEAVQGYSYVLSDQPIDFPDDISEGMKTTQPYKNLSDGIHYFHIKSLRSGSWGGVTHFSIKIDTTPPAHFTIDIAPSARTRVKRPVITFQTTDALSGIGHYEFKIVSLTPREGEPALSPTSQAFFIEAVSPYIPELDFGEYDVIVRAYDRAGNYVQEVKRLLISTAVSDVVGQEGLRINENLVIPWAALWVLGGLGFIVSLFFAVRVMRWHRDIERRRKAGDLPEEIKRKLEELKELREKYKGAIVLLAALGTAALLFVQSPAAAAEEGRREFPPPVMSEVSRSISNEEIFYIGGKTVAPESQIVVYLQSLETGETFSYTTTADRKGDWFYTHPRFLPSGEYLIWTQAKAEGEASPPSSQMPLTVSATALQFGASRLSYETLYLVISLALLGVILAIVLFGIFHYYHGRRKHRHLLTELRGVEESIRRGFAILHRDIKAELALLEKSKLAKGLSDEEKRLEEKILKDLETIKGYIGKEIWEVEREL